jgi:hypothetical protein
MRNIINKLKAILTPESPAPVPEPQPPEPTGFSREQYLRQECDHDTFYAQFVTDGVVYVVLSAIGKERIIKSTNPHFNDIPLAEWDRLKDRVRESMNGKMFKAMVCPNYGKGKILFSLSDAVCIAKRAAKRVRDANQGEVK